jgi:dienelactone hydrolase
METIAESVFGTMEKVSFRRENLTLAGHLFKPADFDDTKVYPTLIVHAAVTMVKEQAPDNYARLLSLHDFVVLTFDYASYGESEGSPRNNENVQGKLEDLKAGVSYLQTLPFVGEIGVLGACTSGGNAAYLAANDDRIAAMAAVVPWMYEPALAEPIWGKEVIARNDAKARDARERVAKTGEYLSTQIFTNTPDIEGFMLGSPNRRRNSTTG